MTSVLIDNIGDLVTLAPLASQARRINIAGGDLGRLGPKAWLVLTGSKIHATGTGPVPALHRGLPRYDAGGGLVLPGLIDSHTHLLFAGSRAAEFCRRASGATYQEIAASGGGIRATMLATRAATDAELKTLVKSRLGQLLRLGVTTVEIKTGYGLSPVEELRHLRLLNDLKAEVPQHVVITCLALHAASPEYATRTDYAKACMQELLPEVAADGLADYVDAFIDEGYFTVDEVRPYAAKAKELGLGLRFHADEFFDAGAASFAAECGALSADHLQYAADAGVARMADRGVIATLLPGTSLYTKIPFTDGRRFADAGVGIALASDFNPGSCRIDNLALLATVGAVQCGLRLPEAVAAVTYVAAAALGLQHRKGAFLPGYDGDIVVYGLSSVEEWLADFGRTPPRAIWAGGQKQ